MTSRTMSDFKIGDVVIVVHADGPKEPPEGMVGEVVGFDDNCVGVKLPGWIGHRCHGAGLSHLFSESNGWWLLPGDIKRKES